MRILGEGFETPFTHRCPFVGGPVRPPSRTIRLSLGCLRLWLSPRLPDYGAVGMSHHLQWGKFRRHPSGL